MQTVPPQTFTPRVFRPASQSQGFSRISVYVWPVIGASQLVQHFQRHEQGWVIFWGILIAFYYFLIIYSAEQRARRMVTPDGVLYVIGDAVLYAPWEDMDRIAPPLRSRRHGTEGIHLREARWQGYRFPLRRMQDGYIPLRSGRYPYWERGAYEALGEYAPWLFAGR